MNAEETQPAKRCRSAWHAVPWRLRLVALFSVCLLATAAALYLLVRILTAMAALSVAVAVALLLAALLQPLTRLLCRLRLPRTLAALVSVLAFLGLLSAVLTLVAGQVATQLNDLGKTLSSGLREVRQVIIAGPIPVDEAQLDSLARAVRDYASDTNMDPAHTASITLQALGGGLLALVLLFFLLRDGERMWGWFVRLFPDRLRPIIAEAGETAWSGVSRYIAGQVAVAAVDAAGIGVALLLIGVPLVAPLALLTFLGGFVPFVGATAAGTAATLVALVANGPTDALLVLAAVIAVQQLEGNLLEPLIVGRALRMHPVPVLLAVTAGALVAGIVGAVIAVPILAVTYRSGAVLLRYRPGRQPEESGRA